MQHISTTPFGRRPLSAGLLAAQALAEGPAPEDPVRKWEVFQDLCRAPAAFGIRPRDLTVLNALLSFHRGAELTDGENLIVFPSNASLGERAHGMAESTLRRHLAALVASGLILRHDSPNGKRYARKGPGGVVALAFGFDLRPLLVRAAEIRAAARAAEEAKLATRLAREACVLLMRDAGKLIAYGEETGRDMARFQGRSLAAARALRRKLDVEGWVALEAELDVLVRDIRRVVALDTQIMSGKDVQIERHQQNSNTDTYDSESCLEKAEQAEAVRETRLALGQVTRACPEVAVYAQGEVRHWHELVSVARTVRPMMGISESAWDAAERAMGREAAAVTGACILQNIDKIRSPGGYLRALTEKAGQGEFTPAPMVMALLHRQKQTLGAES